MAIQIPPIVAVDTMTLVYGLSGLQANGLRRDAIWLFDQFLVRKTQVMVPTIVLAEYLTPFDESEHQEKVEALERRFILKPFTPECASIAATLFRRGSQMRVKNDPGGRAILKADTMVIAVAKFNGVGRLYTHDEGCRKLANTLTPNFAHDLPSAPTDMFGRIPHDE